MKLSTSHWACVLLKPYVACSWITRSSLFVKADRSCSDSLLHLRRISSRMICLPPGGGAAGMGSMVITSFDRNTAPPGRPPGGGLVGCRLHDCGHDEHPSQGDARHQPYQVPGIELQNPSIHVYMSCQRAGSGMVPLQRRASDPRPNARQLSKLDALRLGPARPKGRRDQ
jgi:hypothetical protein